MRIHRLRRRNQWFSLAMAFWMRQSFQAAPMAFFSSSEREFARAIERLGYCNPVLSAYFVCSAGFNCRIQVYRRRTLLKPPRGPARRIAQHPATGRPRLCAVRGVARTAGQGRDALRNRLWPQETPSDERERRRGRRGRGRGRGRRGRWGEGRTKALKAGRTIRADPSVPWPLPKDGPDTPASDPSAVCPRDAGVPRSAGSGR